MNEATWNYRIVKQEGGLTLCEVYYKNGNPEAFCDAHVAGDDMQELNDERSVFCTAITIRRDQRIKK